MDLLIIKFLPAIVVLINVRALDASDPTHGDSQKVHDTEQPGTSNREPARPIQQPYTLVPVDPNRKIYINPIPETAGERRRRLAAERLANPQPRQTRARREEQERLLREPPQEPPQEPQREPQLPYQLHTLQLADPNQPRPVQPPPRTRRRPNTASRHDPRPRLERPAQLAIHDLQHQLLDERPAAQQVPAHARRQQREMRQLEIGLRGITDAPRPPLMQTARLQQELDRLEASINEALHAPQQGQLQTAPLMQGMQQLGANLRGATHAPQPVHLQMTTLQEQLDQLEERLRGVRHGPSSVQLQTAALQRGMKQLEDDLEALQRSQLEPSGPPVPANPDPVTFKCFDKRIRAHTEIINNEITTVFCEVLSQRGFVPRIPTAAFRNEGHSYSTCECRQDHARCIAYRDVKGKFMGVKPPPNAVEGFQPDDLALIPDATTSYITCRAYDFQLMEDPQTKIVQDITLFPHNIRRFQGDKKRPAVKDMDFYCCGVHFLVSRTKDDDILGAKLNPYAEEQFMYNRRYINM